MSPPETPTPGGARCPRCGADLAAEQEWCLHCGTAARTVIAPTPAWRAPVALLAVLAVLAGGALAWAFAAAANQDDEVAAATSRAPAPVTTTATAPAATTTTAPAIPPATVTATPPAGGGPAPGG